MSDSKPDQKRKRKRTTTTTLTTTSSPSATHLTKGPRQNNHHHKSPILSGWTLAISTLDVKGEQHENRDLSYKTIQSLASHHTGLGATVTHQVHKRVSALVCTKTSVMNATQRVRKAIRHGIPLVDVAWLHACQKQDTLVDIQTYLFDHKTLIKPKIKNNDDADDHGGVNPDYEQVPEEGWTDAVDLGCCCVCHENLDPICPWCTAPDGECSIYKGLQANKVMKENHPDETCSHEEVKSKETTTLKKKKKKKLRKTEE